MKNPLVVGYKGEIGSFILQGLLKFLPKANNIWCYDINDVEPDIEERIIWSDVVFLCVPIQKTSSFFEDYGPLLNGKIIIEQTSLKSWIPEATAKLELFNCKLLSMHILFRPSATPNREDRCIALIDKKKWKGFENFIGLMLDSNITYFDTWQDHDIEMANQQLLVHRVILTLAEKCLTFQDGRTYLSKRVLELADRIRGGNPELYKIIQSNDYGKQAIQHFKSELGKFKI